MSKGFTYMVAAYIALWAFLFLYLLVLGVKVTRLEREIKLIKGISEKKK